MTRNETPIIVLDGEGSAGLAVVRSLGRRGIPVIVGSSRPGVIAAQSRYASGDFVYPDTLTSLTEFRNVLLAVLRSQGAALTIPATERTCAALTAGREAFAGYGRLALATNEALAVVLSRSRTRELAGRLRIPLVPRIEVHSISEGIGAANDIGFPVVVAPDSSVTCRGVGTETVGGQYAVDRTELVRRLTPMLRMGSAHIGPPLEGEGVGLAVLCRRGALLWAFQYRRLHEVLPLGGASGCRVSEPVDPALLAHAKTLMRELSWDCAAELQFSRNGGEVRLMRVHGSFGDAIPLVIAAGADVPSFLYDLELHDRRDFRDTYQVGVRCHHLPSELAWARELVRPRTPARVPLPRPTVSSIVADVSRALSSRDRWDTQSVTDPRPGLHELREVSAGLWQSATWRLARAHQRRRMRQAARHPAELVARIARARTLLFVCLGNIIRSAFAAELLRARSLGRSALRIRSAGLDATPDRPADQTAVLCARQFGVDLNAHRTHRLDPSDIAEADVLLAMEIDHVVAILRLFPQYRHKVYLFGCLTNQDPSDVADPVYAPQDAFEACFERIDRGVRRIVEILPPASRALAVASEAG